MKWMTDEYIKNQGSLLKSKYKKTQLRATFTGKQIKEGGTLGRTEATGRGGVAITEALLNKLGKDKTNIKIAVQGFGNVGYYYAKIANEQGMHVVAVSDSKGGITSIGLQDRLDIAKILECKKEKGEVAGCYCVGGVCDIKQGKRLTNEELLELPVDILVPAALENVINKENMDKIKAKIIIEMANGPISEEAYNYLTKKGTLIVPDVLANSGGVAVSYLEWYQNMKGQTWSEAKVNTRLYRMMKDAFEEIWKTYVTRKTSLKQAAFETAIGRIIKKMK
jgi:glutamate dehydrogenase/leucine dehydrogenase